MHARRELSWSLAAISLLAVFVGWIAAVFSEPGLTLSSRFEAYFPAGPWRIALLTIVVALTFSIILTLLEQGLSWLVSRAQNPLEQLEPASIEATIEAVRKRVTESMGGRRPDATRAVDALLRGALLLGASDIHFNPHAQVLKVTYRVDGVLYPVSEISAPYAGRLIGRVKILAQLDSFSQEPQDGSLRRVLGDLRLEARVSSLPADHGDRLVLRLVRGEEAVPQLRDLGLDPSICFEVEALLQKPQGILYVSGPVGSGKTTTLYSAMQFLHEQRGETTSLVTLEDPIEVQLPFATQTQINSKVAMSFAQTLRSVLRQDPGALMLGEVRDRETAQIATQAALTGHLILTTIHVQSAAGTFARLIEMDIEPFLLASSCAGSLAQRLVRKLCPSCRMPHSPTSEERACFDGLGVTLPEKEFFEPVGCASCEARGYRGRIPIVELLVMSEAIQAAIKTKCASEEIHKIAVREGMVPLLQSGLRLAEEGKTSLSEVLRVAG